MKAVRHGKSGAPPRCRLIKIRRTLNFSLRSIAYIDFVRNGFAKFAYKIPCERKFRRAICYVRLFQKANTADERQLLYFAGSGVCDAEDHQHKEDDADKLQRGGDHARHKRYEAEREA